MSMGALVLSAMSALAKFAASSLPSSEVVFFRSLIASVMLVAWHLNLVRTGRNTGPLPGHKVNRLWLVLRGVFGATALLLFFYGLSGLATADAMLLNICSPVWILLLGLPVLNERISPVALAMVPVTLLGAGLIIKPDFAMVNWAGLAAFASSILAALAHLCVRKVTRGEQAHVVILYFAFTATAVSFPLMFDSYVHPGPWTWIALFGVGTLSVIYQFLLTTAYRYGAAGTIAMAGYLGPVFAGVWDAIFWKHLPDWLTLVGASLIIGSLLQLNRQRSHGSEIKSREETPRNA